MDAPTIRADEGAWHLLSCGCDLRNGDTGNSSLGVVRCKHGRQIFTPFVAGVQLTSPQLTEMRTHLL